MILVKEAGGCGHEHPTPEEWDDIMEAVVACEDGFEWEANGYRRDIANLIWMRMPDGKAHIAILPVRLVYGPPVPPSLV